MKYNFLDLAIEVLNSSDVPLSVNEIWENAVKLGFTDKVNSSGKTPQKTLGAAIYMDIRDNEKSLLYQSSKRPAKFYLKSKKNRISNDEVDDKEDNEKEEKTSYNERELHILLSSFVQADAHFKCKTKTIYHEKSSKCKKGKNQWLHPDIVGIYYPFNDYSSQVINLFSIVAEKPYKLFSFEMKKEINYSNLREYYFQAVSNSSWANEGYLVTLKIKDNDEGIYEELRRLNNAFGIGIIKLNPVNISQSEILFLAHEKKKLDWDTIQRLSEENRDFEEFIEDVCVDAEGNDKRLRGKYDKYFTEDEEAEKYAKEHKII